MIVISKVGNKRLIKGHRYEVQNLWNAGNNQRWIEGVVELVGFGRYVVDSFTDTSGNPLPKSNWHSNKVSKSDPIKFEDLKEGEILVCTTDHYKTMAKGQMYKIERLVKIDHQRKSFSGQVYTVSDKSIKFVGLNRRLKFNGWCFRKLTAEESREISLGSILSGEEPNIIKSSKLRKIDIIINKEKALMEVLSKTILDTNRHHLSIVEWTCQKTGEKLRIVPEDFTELLDMKLSDILAKIEK